MGEDKYAVDAHTEDGTENKIPRIGCVATWIRGICVEILNKRKGMPYPKLSYMMLSGSTPRLSRYSVTVLISMGGPQR